jgi:hypothetical protein
VDPVPDPLLLRKSGSAGNRTGTLTTRPQTNFMRISHSVHACCMYDSAHPYLFIYLVFKNGKVVPVLN